MRHPVRTFLLHLLVLIVAMSAGMMILFPLWTRIARGAAATSWLVQIETLSLVMATTMALPVLLAMVLMRYRWVRAVEAALTMYAGFVVLFPLHWFGLINAGQVMVIGHVTMGLFLIIDLVRRWRGYVADRQLRSGVTTSADQRSPAVG